MRMIKKYDDIEIVKEKDYIKNPKPKQIKNFFIRHLQ